jgi:hypothetical protein
MGPTLRARWPDQKAGAPDASRADQRIIAL